MRSVFHIFEIVHAHVRLVCLHLVCTHSRQKVLIFVHSFTTQRFAFVYNYQVLKMVYVTVYT